MTRDEASRRGIAWSGDAPTRRAALGAAAAVLAVLYAVQAGAEEEPGKGGMLVYLEQQAHASLYPPAGGFYPNGGILNQISDKLTYQNPKTLEIEPWIAKSWTVDADATIYTFEIRAGVTFSDGTPVDAAAVAKNFDTFGLGNKELKLPVSEAINNDARSEVLGPLKVRFHFTKPSPGFLQATSVIGSGLVSPKTLSLPFDQLGTAILSISTLGFLGYGAPPPTPEWGLLIAEGRNYISRAWWLTTTPGIVVVLVVLAANRISRSFAGAPR